MPDGLYDRDILAWSEHQAGLLRRLGRGEKVNDVDWDHLVEEIEDVGLSELRAVESFLHLIMLHLLKLARRRDDPAVPHWRTEIVSFQRQAARRFAASMRQRIALEALYQDAVAAIEAADDQPGRWPPTCPFTLDALLGQMLVALAAGLDRGAEAGA